MRHGAKAWVGAAVLGALLMVAACDDPCEELARKVCQHVRSAEACATWKAKIEVVDRQTCRTALEGLQAATR